MKHVFADPALMELALTHTSWAHENGGEHNERLEFLGDAVLQVCATELLYTHFGAEREGVLHRYRTQLVQTSHLAGLARRWQLDEQVRLGRGEESTAGRDKARLLAGVFEAVLGAIFLDGGFDAVRVEIQGALRPDLDQLAQVSDARRVLHEWAQAKHGAPASFEVTGSTGPDHDRVFTVQVCVAGEVVGEGTGGSKRTASIQAARAAVASLAITP
jgi:ribonuclease-3